MKRQPSEEIAFAYRWAILGILWTAYVVVFVQRLSIGPLGPFLKEDMGITSAQVGSLMSAASFGQMFSMAPGGWLADRVGVRWLLVVGEMAAGIAMLGMFFGPSYGAALAIMTAAGLGCGCLTPGTTKGVMVWFPTRERATAMGFKQTGVNVAGIVTAMVLPTVALALGWRFGFLFLRVVAIAIALCSFTLYREPTAAVDPRSVNRATHADIAKPATGRPLLELLRSRDIWLVAIAGLALVTVEFAVIAHLVLYLTEALLFPVVAAGMILAATEAGGALGKPGGGFLSDRFFGGSRRKVYILWGGIALAACALITLWGGGSLSWALLPILFALGVTSIGWGGVHLTLVAELAGKDLAGTATGAVGVLTIAGTVLGPILFGYIVDVSGSYQLAWLSLTICSAICVATLFFVREERRRIELSAHKDLSPAGDSA